MSNVCINVRSGGGISTEAQAMLDNYSSLGNALTGNQRDRMIFYVDSLVSNGLYALIDLEAILKLGSVNGLVDWRRGVFMTNNNAVTFDANGAVFDGVNQWINTLYNPNSAGVAYQLNDALMGAYVSNVNNKAGNCVGGRRVSSSSIARILAGADGSYSASLNGAGAATGNLINGELFVIDRISSTDISTYEGGILVENNPSATIGTIPNANISIGAQSGTSNYFDGTISSFVMGGGVGFDQAAYNSVHKALLAAI